MDEAKTSFGDDVRAPENAAAPERKRRAFSLDQFFFGAKSRPAPTPRFNGDALAALYSTHHHHDDVSFGFLLRQSAAAIERGRILIASRGAEIAAAISRAGSAEARLAAWGARLLIALFWVFIGVVLTREASSGFSTRGLDPGAAAMLARIFVGVGVLGAAVAMVGGFLARAGEAGLFADAHGFGAEAGAIVREFGEATADIRARIADESKAAAATDLSRLHLVAVEAAAFLEGVSFLAEPDHARAAERFRAFLDSKAPPAFSASAALALMLAGLAALIGGVLLSGAGAGLPVWAVVALPGFALLYAALGLVFSAAGVGAGGGASARARDEALTRLRKAYVAAGAPRADDIIEDVEAALAAFRRRIGDDDRRLSPGAGSDWRAPETGPRGDDAGPRFVAQTFEAAPPVFRTERQGPLRKNFFSGGRRNAEPKQWPGAPDAPPWLKN